MPTVLELPEIQTADTPARLSSVVTEDDLAGLPTLVQRYLTFSGILGKPRVETVHLQYTGRFRMGTDKPWMKIGVNQFYTVNPPGFLWKATFKMAGIPFMRVRDTYKAGHGHMLGKVAGLFTVVDGKGEEIGQGTMLRYVQEMSWFPSAYLGENITWQAVDDHAADVTLQDSDKTVSARMYFDDAGRMLTFVAQRYGEFEGKYQIRTWTAPITEYQEFSGLRLPSSGRGVWQLADGDLTYVDVNLTQIEFNQPIETF